jgi:hypothetical protein
MHGKGERKASKDLHASCMDDAMVEIVELESGSAQARTRRKIKRRPQKEWEEQGMLMGYSPRRVTTVEPSLCVRPYTVYARQVKQEQTSEW